MNYIVTKSTKSKGIAILLVAFLGPIGMFYSTILGGVIMTLGAPLMLYALFAKAAFSHSEIFVLIAIIWAFIAYIFCFLWAVSAVDNYNYKIIQEANPNVQYSIPSDPYKTWMIIFLVIGLVVTWWIYYRYTHKTDQKLETVSQKDFSTDKKVEEIKPTSQEEKKMIENKKEETFTMNTLLYSGHWFNTDLDITGYKYELYLKEKNLRVEGTLDRFTLKGAVKEAYEEDDLLRRELIAHLFDKEGKEIALISFDLNGDYEKNWNEMVRLTVKEKYSEEPLLDVFNGVLFSKK